MAGPSEEQLAGTLAYCRLTELADDPEVSALIPVLYRSAEGYLAGAGILPPAQGTPRAAQYELLIHYLVLDAWERRETSMPGTIMTDNPVFRRLMVQMKLTR